MSNTLSPHHQEIFDGVRLSFTEASQFAWEPSRFIEDANRLGRLHAALEQRELSESEEFFLFDCIFGALKQRHGETHTDDELKEMMRKQLVEEPE